jgi:vacuolar protein sorting-associated protein 26
MEVGIEECLHIEFEFPKSHYTLNDCLVGNVSFKLVKINIKYMEVNIIKRELTG